MRKPYLLLFIPLLFFVGCKEKEKKVVLPIKIQPFFVRDGVKYDSVRLVLDTIHNEWGYYTYSGGIIKYVSQLDSRYYPAGATDKEILDSEGRKIHAYHIQKKIDDSLNHRHDLFLAYSQKIIDAHKEFEMYYKLYQFTLKERFHKQEKIYLDSIEYYLDKQQQFK